MNISYIKSADIEVFPSGYRDSQFIAAKRTSEENLTSRRISGNPDNANYCFETDGGANIELYLAGYRFKFSKIALVAALNLNALKSQTIYAFINTANPDGDDEDTEPGDSYVGNILINAAEEAGSTFTPQAGVNATIVGTLDIGSGDAMQFCGIGFSTTDPENKFTAKLAMSFDDSGNLSSNTLTIDATNIRNTLGEVRAEDKNKNITQVFDTNKLSATKLIVNAEENTYFINTNTNADSNKGSLRIQRKRKNTETIDPVKLEVTENGFIGVYGDGVISSSGSILNTKGSLSLDVVDGYTSGAEDAQYGKLRITGEAEICRYVIDEEGKDTIYTNNSALMLSDVNLKDPNNPNEGTSIKLSAGLTGSDGAAVSNTSVQLLYPADENGKENSALCLPKNISNTINKHIYAWFVAIDEDGKATNKWESISDTPERYHFTKPIYTSGKFSSLDNNDIESPGIVFNESANSQLILRGNKVAADSDIRGLLVQTRSTQDYPTIILANENKETGSAITAVPNGFQISAHGDGKTLSGTELLFAGKTSDDSVGAIRYNSDDGRFEFNSPISLGTNTLGIANGGTGATTAESVLINLGITATATELNYVDGVKSNIQTQLDEHTHKYAGSSTAGGSATTAITATNADKIKIGNSYYTVSFSNGVLSFSQ